MLLDVTAANPNNASSVAKAIYTAKGSLETRTGTVASSRVLHLVGLEVEKRIVHGQHGDDGPDTIVTTYTVPPGTNFYYANDADATNRTTNGMYSNDTNLTQSSGRSPGALGGFTGTAGQGTAHLDVDPEFVTDHLAHEEFGLTGGTSISNTSTTNFSTNVGSHNVDYNNESNDDNSGHTDAAGQDNSGGSWT